MRGTGKKYGNKRDRSEFEAKTMRGRGQPVKLKNNDTGQEVRRLVILPDSKQGYLASDNVPFKKDKAGNWAWYNLNEWSEVK